MTDNVNILAGALMGIAADPHVGPTWEQYDAPLLREAAERLLAMSADIARSPQPERLP